MILGSATDTYISSTLSSNIQATTSVNLTSGTTINLNSTGHTNITSTANMYLAAATILELTCQDVNVVTTDDFNVNTTGGISMVSGARINMTATDYVDVINTDFHIQQLNYNPFDSQYQIGYTVSSDLDCGTVSATTAEETNFTLPSKGVWLIIMGFEWTSVSNTILTKSLSISGTSASLVGLANGLVYYDGIDDITTANQIRQKLTMSGVYASTGSKIAYVNADATVNIGTRPSLKIKYSYTRLG